MNPEIGQAAVDDKSIVLDIRARLQTGTTINVEMQTRNVPPFRKRFLYYWARTFSDQLRPGDTYRALRPTISIALLSYREPQNSRFHSIFRLLETQDHTPYGDSLELHLIQLPRLPELTDADRLADAPLLRWTQFFEARSDQELDQAAMNDPALSKARDLLRDISAEPDARRMAEERERAQITRAIEDTALRDEGREEGRQQGREEGREAGRLQQLRETIVDLCDVIGVPLDVVRLAHLDAAPLDELLALRQHIKQHHTWP